MCPTCKKQRLKCSDGGLTCIEGWECIENSLYLVVSSPVNLIYSAKAIWRVQSPSSSAQFTVNVRNPILKPKTSQISANRQNNSAKLKQKSAIPIDFGAIPSKKSANPILKRKNIPDKRKQAK